MKKNLIVNFLYARFGHLLHDLNQPWLSPQHLQMYADAIHNKGAALDNCWVFVDGTVRPICRPKEHQRAVYNGHKRVHALKFQTVVTPNDHKPLWASLGEKTWQWDASNVRSLTSVGTDAHFTSRPTNVHL